MASQPNKKLALAAAILGSAVALLDGTIVSVALPTIQRHLGGGLAGQQWITSAYLLTLGSLILIGGSLGDIFGERRIFTLGVAGFGAASLLCALAPSIGVLIAARALQGVAGALLTPSSLAVIVATFDDDERGAAIGTWTAFGAIANVIGPLAGGELLAVASWRWLFLINLPLVAITIALIRTAIPVSVRPSGGRRRIDFAGAALCAGGLAGIAFALIEAPRLGWSNPGIDAGALAGVALLAGFLVRERLAPDPMLPLSLFRRRNFSASNLETFVVYGALSVFFFFLVLFLQQVGGYSPLRSGLSVLPATIILFALSRRVGALSGRLGPRRFMAAGPLIAACGLLLALRIGTAPGYFTEVLPAVVVFAFGLSLTVAPLTTTVLAGIETDRAGIASATNNALARVAGLLATAGIGALVAAHFASALRSQLHGVALGHAARTTVTQAQRLVIGIPGVGHLPAGQGAAIVHAAAAASLSSFRLGVGIAAALLALGGLVGAAWVRSPQTV